MIDHFLLRLVGKFGSICFPGAARFVILCVSVFSLSDAFQCFGDDSKVFAHPTSWHHSGRLAFRSGTRDDSTIQLLDLSSGKPKIGFSTKIAKTVQPPICFGTRVAAVGTDGEIYVLDPQGELIFKSKPPGFEGASFASGRLTENHLFMTEALWSKKKKKWAHLLYIVDVSGHDPVIKAKFTTIQPDTITSTSDEIIIIGKKKTQRLNIPAQCHPAMKAGNARDFLEAWEIPAK